MNSVLCFITKATSSLDFLIPLVKQAKDNNFSFTFLFWDDQDYLIKGQSYYKEALKDAVVIDLKQLMRDRLSLTSNLLWSFRIYKRIMRLESTDIELISEYILKKIQPDIILFDHREAKKYGINSLKNEILKSNIPTVLIPHAPHHTGTAAFVKFSEKIDLPPNFKYWTAFKYDDYSYNFSAVQKKQFKYVGYPGLDDVFLNNLNNSQLRKLNFNTSNPKKVVLILRKIFPKKVLEQPKDHDNFAFFYKEFLEMLLLIHKSLSESFQNFELYLKPHPATNLNELTELITKTELKNILIDNDSIYSQLNKYDLFLSFYSTTILIPMANKKLSFILDSRIQNEIRHWEPMRKLYDDSPNFLRNISDLTHSIKNVQHNEEFQKLIDKCYKHLRDYYPGNSCELIFNEMKDIIYASKE